MCGIPDDTKALEHVKSNKSIWPFEQRAHIGCLLGYRASTQYVIWVPSMNTKKVVVSANVKFDESNGYHPDREIDAIKYQRYTYKMLQEMEAIDPLEGNVEYFKK